MEPIRRGGPRRLRALEQRLEQVLFTKVGDQSLGRDLLLALDHAQHLARKLHGLDPGTAVGPQVIHQSLPRIASRYSTTRMSPWTLRTCSQGTPPVCRFSVWNQ